MRESMPVRKSIDERITRRLERITLLRAMSTIVLVAAILAVVSAVLEWAVDPEFETFGQSLWWAVVTITTVGYGDVVPESTAGRFVAGMLMLTGIGLIPVITSTVVSVLIARRSQAEKLRAEAERAELLELLTSIERRLSDAD